MLQEENQSSAIPPTAGADTECNKLWLLQQVREKKHTKKKTLIFAQHLASAEYYYSVPYQINTNRLLCGLTAYWCPQADIPLRALKKGLSTRTRI